MNALRVLLLLSLVNLAHAFGVVVLNAGNLQILPPANSAYDVYVENQAAVTHVRSEFVNPLNNAFEPVWAFPLPVEASATRLRYRLNGSWTEVPIGIGPQDPGLPGGTPNPALTTFLGPTPIVFHFEHNLVPDSTLIVELDYVEFLPYENGTVSMRHPGNLAPILPFQIISTSYSLNLASDRDIQSLTLTSGQVGADIGFVEGTGHIDWHDLAGYPDLDFTVEYQLSLDQLGLFATSTMIPDSLMPEDGANGFLMFVAEPDPDDQQAIMDKVFTLILDRSGSMGGNKMVQARAAASFIVTHLNEGDRFNLISFASGMSAFQPEHVEYTPVTESQALSWIAAQNASGSTNISGAFDMAVPQFDNASSTTANIIIFLTDGVPTMGITDPTTLTNHIDNLFDALDAPLNLFSFGIGMDVNHPLLGQISAHNNGFAEFLENDELETRISEFYLLVRNPVLMQPWVETTPAVLDLAPQPLPNLYVGRQMIVAARYTNPAPLSLTLHGTAFGQPVEYTYMADLSGGYEESRAYLPKVWAKRTIETMMIQYYQLDPESQEALDLHDEIVALSITWSVISPFTSFNDNTSVPDDGGATQPVSLLLVENFPNPFNPSTTLRITVPAGLPEGPMMVRLYNIRGQLVRTLAVVVSGAGVYDITWNGLDDAGRQLASGTYLAMVSFGDQIVAHRLTLLK
ncbi:MAG: VWA domain-containing protein [Candidatus Delongbacteria bacterium]|nr:VWA domain-containing protein [Candidatus Delongbacteria bacterium]